MPPLLLKLSFTDCCSWMPSDYVDNCTPPSPSISLVHTYRDKELVSVPCNLLVQGDVVILGPGHSAPAQMQQVNRIHLSNQFQLQWTILPTYLVLFMLGARKAITREHQRCLSIENFKILPHVHPCSFNSFSADLCQVSFGPPPFLFPCGVHLMAILGSAFGSNLFICPIQHHRLVLVIAIIKCSIVIVSLCA